jgi:hypothetical protein
MSDKSENRIHRRRVLGLLGSGTAGAVFSTGLAGAKRGRGRGKKKNPERRPNNGVGPCTCSECPDGTFCGKVEGAPEEGKTYTFSSEGERYSVTIESVTENESGEVTCFTITSNDNIEKLCVKGGPETATYHDPENEDLCAPLNPGGQKPEISNFSVCGSQGCICYQVDLVWWKEDYPIEDVGEEQYGSTSLIEAYHDDTCNDDGPARFNYENSEVERDDCEIVISNIGWDVQGTEITATFDLDCEDNASVNIGLASYEADCNYGDDLTDMPLDGQVCEDSDNKTFSEGTDHTLTVDLPV